MPGWRKHKLESRLLGEISITSDMQMTPSMCRKWRGIKESLDEGERGEWKSWLKTQHSKKWRSWHLFHHIMQIDGETVETVTDLIFMGFKVTADGDYSHDIKRHLLLGRKAMTNLESVLKSRVITSPTKVHVVKTIVFLVVVYGCEIWTIKMAKCQTIDAFELWCWRRLLKDHLTARRSNQSILKEIKPEFWLEGLMLKLKLQ